MNQNDAELLPDSIPLLEEDIARIEREEKECQAQLEHFLRSEDFSAGVYYSQEIHNQRQTKLRLHVEKEFRRKKINRLRLAAEDEYF